MYNYSIYVYSSLIIIRYYINTIKVKTFNRVHIISINKVHTIPLFSATRK